ncbi:MAG TPA: A24 family peptidase [Stellaceae bacterium]|nr:A24 family peptidase [Stellaceae bacterium]
MPAPATILLLLVSPFIGSFLGVVAKRVHRPGTILWDRSRCESCQQNLGPRDLVPLLSWIARRGRCRHCGARLGWFYPALELAALGVAIWSAALASGWPLWATAGFGWAMLILAVIDVRDFLLPDFLTLPLIPLGLVVNAALDRASLGPHLLGAAAGFLFVIALRYAYWRWRGREGIGLGDAKLLAAAGAWVSWEGLPSVVALAACAGLAAILLHYARGARFSLTDRVPFGAFLCLGLWIVWLYGPLA